LPKGHDKPTYSNDTQKHTIVEDFCVSYINHTVMIRNEPIDVVDWSPGSTAMTGTCVLVIGNTAFPLMNQEEVKTWVTKNKIKMRRGNSQETSGLAN
jgi:hypothetical protein